MKIFQYSAIYQRNTPQCLTNDVTLIFDSLKWPPPFCKFCSKNDASILLTMEYFFFKLGSRLLQKKKYIVNICDVHNWSNKTVNDSFVTTSQAVMSQLTG